MPARSRRQPADPEEIGFEHSILVACAPVRALEAFFDPKALAHWWRATRSVATPSPLGVYAVEWEPSSERDEMLGRLGGVFHGTVIDYQPAREFFVSEAWWHGPDGDPIGPMSLEVSCRMEGAECRLTVRQRGFEENPRWRRYYEVIGRGWLSSLETLKTYLELRG